MKSPRNIHVLYGNQNNNDKMKAILNEPTFVLYLSGFIMSLAKSLQHKQSKFTTTIRIFL